MQGDETILIHRPHISGPQPTILNGLCRGLRVLPIAAHHNGPRHQNLTNFTPRQCCSRLIADANQHRALRHAYRPKTRAPIRMGAVADKVASQGCNPHRAFPLAINLHKFISQDLNRRDNISDIHRPARIGDCFDTLPIAANGTRPLDKTFDHGWGSKH